MSSLSSTSLMPIYFDTKMPFEAATTICAIDSGGTGGLSPQQTTTATASMMNGLLDDDAGRRNNRADSATSNASAAAAATSTTSTTNGQISTSSKASAIVSTANFTILAPMASTSVQKMEPASVTSTSDCGANDNNCTMDGIQLSPAGNWQQTVATTLHSGAFLLPSSTTGNGIHGIQIGPSSLLANDIVLAQQQQQQQMALQQHHHRIPTNSAGGGGKTHLTYENMRCPICGKHIFSCFFLTFTSLLLNFKLFRGQGQWISLRTANMRVLQGHLPFICCLITHFQIQISPFIRKQQNFFCFSLPRFLVKQLNGTSIT